MNHYANIIRRLYIDIDTLNESKDTNETNVDFKLVNNELIYKSYKFIIDYKYPFTTPKLMVEDTDYINYFIKKYNVYNEKLPFIKVKCPCCYNIICNWSPCYNLTNIFNEYKEYREIYNQLFHFFIFYNAKIFDDLVYKNISDYFIDQY